MKVNQIFAFLILISSLYTCNRPELEVVNYADSVKGRAAYLNNLKLSELYSEDQTLSCHLIQPNFNYFDNIAFEQNLKYLFQDMATIKISTIDSIKIYVSIPNRSESSKLLYEEYNFKEFQMLLSDYQNQDFKEQFNQLFVMNDEYRERGIFNDLNHLSGEFLNNKAKKKIYDMGFDVTLLIKDLIMNCDNQNLSDTISTTIIGYLKEVNPEYPVVYDELEEYFDKLCEK